MITYGQVRRHTGPRDHVVIQMYRFRSSPEICTYT